MAKEVGGVGDGVEEVGSDEEGDAVGVVVATMATMTTEMLATRVMAMVTMKATMTSVMWAEIMGMVEGTAGDGTGKKGVVAEVDDGPGEAGMVGTAMATLLTVVLAVELAMRRPVTLAGGRRWRRRSAAAMASKKWEVTEKVTRSVLWWR